MSTTAPSSLFDRQTAVQDLRAALLATGLESVAGAEFSDELLWGKLLAAEKDAERRLRVYFQPTEIFPHTPTEAEIAALEGRPWDEEPGYDYEPEFFMGESWGYIATRHKPILEVKRIHFAYPSPAEKVYTIPDSWIRVDKRYGHIRLVPAAQAFSAPLSAYIMQALGGGRTIPFMIHVRYVTGLRNVNTEWPDLVDLVMKMATLRTIIGTFPAQSGSISADGLSGSLSIDLDKWEGVIDKHLDELRDRIHGVRMIVL